MSKNRPQGPAGPRKSAPNPGPTCFFTSRSDFAWGGPLLAIFSQNGIFGFYTWRRPHGFSGFCPCQQTFWKNRVTKSIQNSFWYSSWPNFWLLSFLWPYAVENSARIACVYFFGLINVDDMEYRISVQNELGHSQVPKIELWHLPNTFLDPWDQFQPSPDHFSTFSKNRFFQNFRAPKVTFWKFDPPTLQTCISAARGRRKLVLGSKWSQGSRASFENGFGPPCDPLARRPAPNANFAANPELAGSTFFHFWHPHRSHIFKKNFRLEKKKIRKI